MESVSFQPLISDESQILILGTMPGIKSLQMQQYYANERNAFWLIFFKLFKQEFSNHYQSRKNLILNNRIAIWDTLEYCYREGSLDSGIKNEKPNDIPGLIKSYPNISNIIFNGKAAEKFYTKFHKKIDRIEYFCLPSTSPANARLKIEDKFNEWTLIRDLL